jgi:hypothetical protein
LAQARIGGYLPTLPPSRQKVSAHRELCNLSAGVRIGPKECHKRLRIHRQIEPPPYYGPSIVDADRQWATYAGRILRGAKPVDLPVMQASKCDSSLTARRQVLPPTLLALADEVIE